MPKERVYIRLGTKIKQLRLERKMTQEDLAAKCYISREYISSIESASKRPSVLVLQDIAHALHVRIDELLR